MHKNLLETKKNKSKKGIKMATLCSYPILFWHLCDFVQRMYNKLLDYSRSMEQFMFLQSW